MSTNQEDTKVALDALNELDQLNEELPTSVIDNAHELAVMEETLSTSNEDSHSPLPSMTDQEFDGTMSELNRFLGSVYKDMAQINSVFNQAAKFCMERAEEWADAAEKSGKGINSDEGVLAIAVAGVGIAMNGLGKLLQIWEKQKKIYEYKRICESIVETKGPHIDSMVSLAKRAVDDALSDLDNVCGQQIDVSSALTNAGDESYRAVKGMLMSSLNRYRESQYVFDQMIWLRDQMIAWSKGELEDASSPYPSYQDINQQLFFSLHPYDENANVENSKIEIEATCDYVVDEYLKMTGGVYHTVNSDFLMSLCDNELMATLLNNCSENTKYKLLALYQTVDSDNLRNALEGELSDSTALQTVCDLEIETTKLDVQEKKHRNLMIVNGLLLFIMAFLPVFLTDWAWYWKTIVGVLIGFPILYRTSKAVGRIKEKTDIKIDLIRRWEQSQILKMTGYKPQSKSITRMQNGIWATIIAAIIGGVVGSFILPPLGTIVGACLGALVGGDDEEEEESNGSNWKSFETGSIPKTITWTVILGALLIAEFYWLFK